MKYIAASALLFLAAVSDATKVHNLPSGATVLAKEPKPVAAKTQSHAEPVSDKAIVAKTDSHAETVSDKVQTAATKATKSKDSKSENPEGNLRQPRLNDSSAKVKEDTKKTDVVSAAKKLGETVKKLSASQKSDEHPAGGPAGPAMKYQKSENAPSGGPSASLTPQPKEKKEERKKDLPGEPVVTKPVKTAEPRELMGMPKIFWALLADFFAMLIFISCVPFILSIVKRRRPSLPQS
eukprot:TRINITY_DN605_c0_g2_i1.p1 TRINITY_DN605_c0_g2~~TRINITY_DN605_c0_g2_i1.p1  ORF type:complete len:237 (+),score=49.39 TRINITY_DN605_c0_g2_i1:210-920(+)